jgi:hypothetical protein
MATKIWVNRHRLNTKRNFERRESQLEQCKGAAGPEREKIGGLNPIIDHVTRFNPGNAHVCGISRHGALVGSSKLDGDQMKAEGHKFYPGSAPLVG